MNLYKFIKRNTSFNNLRYLVLLIFLCGIANAATVIMIATAVDDKTQINFLLLLIIIGFYYFSAQEMNYNISCILENAISCTRDSIVHYTHTIELETLERLSKEKLYTIFVRDLEVISQFRSLASLVTTSCVSLVALLFYISIISPKATIFAVLMIFLCVAFFHFITAKIKHISEQTTEVDNKIVSLICDILNGFKEIKMSHARKNDIFQDLEESTLHLRKQKGKLSDLNVKKDALYKVSTPLCIGVLVLFPSFTLQTGKENLIKIVLCLQFLRDFFTPIVFYFSSLLNTEETCSRVNDFLAKVDNDKQDKLSLESANYFSNSNNKCNITLKNICYSYPATQNQKPFSIGPINYNFPHNKITFIVGNNGSGKSTLLKLLTGLYLPSSGEIYMGDVIVDREKVEYYRQHFSIVFNDFYLFIKAYGLEIDKEKAQSLFKEMELQEKVNIENRYFTNLSLSSGEKKRLALIVSLLEDRDIYVFDELIADQDPRFKKYFYTEFFPYLKQQGKTIIAVTHDHNYFHTADSVLRLEDV